MVKAKSKKRRVFIVIVVLFIGILISVTPYWYFVLRVPNDYGQLVYSGKNETQVNLIFNGKKYKVVPDKSYIGFGHLGRVKEETAGDPIIIYSVLGHPDLVVVADTALMGWGLLFQEEK